MNVTAKLRNPQGFTLTEILVTLVIMGLIATAVGSFYISSTRQVNTQLEVVDVQSNLRMVMDKLVSDIQRAGFMTGANPIDSALSTNTTMTINTASVTGKFARLTNTVTATGSNDTFNVGDNAMVDLFHVGDSVRIIRPPLHEEPVAGIFTISALGTGTISVNGITAGTEIRPGDILVGTRTGAPLVNTVTYSLDGNRNLIRTVNGSDQIFGQNITGINLVYDGDPIRTVQVTLTGTTDPKKTGQAGYGGLKTRTLRNQVTVRNL